jgi:hypothetical protein
MVAQKLQRYMQPPNQKQQCANREAKKVIVENA